MANLESVRYGIGHSLDSGEARGWLVRLTKIGFAAKGIVYLLIGVLALLAAFQKGGETTDQRGVIQKIAGQPFGEFALIVIAAGLMAYAVWRFLCAFANAEQEPGTAKGMVKRFGYFISGIVYGGLAWTAIGVVRGNGAGQDQTQSLTARLMQAPAGAMLVALAGAVIVAAGIYFVRKGIKEEFVDKLQMRRMSRTEQQWARRAGKAGYIARGAVFAIIGMFFIFAGLNTDPSQAKGLEGALDTLAAQPFGQILLGVVALGLAMYGVFCVAEARYRTIHT